MALLSRDPPPFLYGSRSLPTKDAFQPLSRRFSDNPAGICCTKSCSATIWRFPQKSETKQRHGPLKLSSCNILRREKRPRKDTISNLGFLDSVSLFGIILQSEDPDRFNSGRPSRHVRAIVHHFRHTSIRAGKGECRTEPGRAEYCSWRRVFTRKGLAGVTHTAGGDCGVQKVNVLARGAEEGGRGGSEESEREVIIEVEAVSWRERQIRANVCVEASYQVIWDVLTDYERLVEFIPNLVRSERVTSPHPQRIWLLQQGVQSAMYWHIEARVVLDLEELPHAVDGKELRFLMVDGDFKHYAGRWYLRPGPRFGTTNLHFEVNVTPKLFFPAAFLDRIISKNLPKNLRAIAHRSETYSEWKNIRGPSKLYFKQPIPSPLLAFRNKPPAPSQVFPAGLMTTSLQGTATETEHTAKDNLSGFEFDTSLLGEKSDWLGTETCQLDKSCVVDEVHLRRLDDLLENGGGHRRVVAAMTVESPVKDVWKVLTDYECLSEFIPNLASCKIISRKNHHVRLMQEGCKNIFFMVLHARAVLDLWEKPEHEIIFQQVEGDFDSLRGKWNLESLGAQHTLLKYVVDIKMHKHCLLAEAIIEEITYVDLAKNLCAIRAQVEMRREKAAQAQAPAVQEVVRKSLQPSLPSESTSARLLPTVEGKRFRVAGLQKDFRVFEKELFAFIMEHGREGYMPMRRELREHKRVDLEKAIFRVGGFSVVATRLNLSQQRRPRGYWDHFQNLRKEILLFQIESGLDETYMPTRNSLNKAGRHDVARALEKWGGVQEVARLLGLKVRRVSLRSPAKIMALRNSSATENDLVPQKPFKTSLPSKPKKWVDLKQ